ncbi:MAG TPA: hypothetical protein VMT24_11855 [Aggregatilineaceae bacterium]|jgi:cysteine synthase B|nr:hypothetical protein [Aggregatilineaceae bacterium]
MIGASRGYTVKLVVPANASPERVTILIAYGVNIVLTGPQEGSDGAICEARARRGATGYVFLPQTVRQ